jgi:hypothetical protein
MKEISKMPAKPLATLLKRWQFADIDSLPESYAKQFLLRKHKMRAEDLLFPNLSIFRTHAALG